MANFLTKLFHRESPTPAPIASSEAKVERVIIDNGETTTINSPTQAEKIAAVYAAAEALATTVAKLPLEYKRRNTALGVFVDYIDSDLFYLLSMRPSPWHTAYSFWYTVVWQMKMLGNAYAYIQRSGASIEGIILLSPNTCNYDESNDVYTVCDQIHGVFGTYMPEDILHFSNGNMTGGRVGKSTIAYAGATLGIQAAADKETKSRFVSGGKMKAVFTNDTSVKGFGAFSVSSLENEAKDIESKFRRGADIVAVPGDGKLLPLSMTSTDMEILGSKKFGIREICRFFHVPPSKIYDDYNHAYNAGETENISFLVDSIEPLLMMLEQELFVKLLGYSALMAKNYRILFDREKMFTVNSITKADYYTKMLATGVVSVNDLRRKENRPAIEGGDTPLITCNVAPINSTKITGEEKSGQPNDGKMTKE